MSFPKDYDKLAAGREVDALVAERVMGWKRFPQCSQLHRPDMAPDRHTLAHHFPEYSTDIAAAWGVVEKLRSGKFTWIKDCGGFGWRVEILSSSPTDIQIDCFAMADTATLAICRAALKLSLEGAAP